MHFSCCRNGFGRSDHPRHVTATMIFDRCWLYVQARGEQRHFQKMLLGKFEKRFLVVVDWAVLLLEERVSDLAWVFGSVHPLSLSAQLDDGELRMVLLFRDTLFLCDPNIPQQMTAVFPKCFDIWHFQNRQRVKAQMIFPDRGAHPRNHG